MSSRRKDLKGLGGWISKSSNLDGSAATVSLSLSLLSQSTNSLDKSKDTTSMNDDISISGSSVNQKAVVKSVSKGKQLRRKSFLEGNGVVVVEVSEHESGVDEREHPFQNEIVFNPNDPRVSNQRIQRSVSNLVSSPRKSLEAEASRRSLREAQSSAKRPQKFAAPTERPKAVPPTPRSPRKQETAFTAPLPLSPLVVPQESPSKQVLKRKAPPKEIVLDDAFWHNQVRKPEPHRVMNDAKCKDEFDEQIPRASSRVHHSSCQGSFSVSEILDNSERQEGEDDLDEWDAQEEEIVRLALELSLTDQNSCYQKDFSDSFSEFSQKDSISVRAIAKGNLKSPPTSIPALDKSGCDYYISVGQQSSAVSMVTATPSSVEDFRFNHRISNSDHFASVDSVASYRFEERSLLGREDLTVNSDEERAMIELAMERSLQDCDSSSRQSRTHMLRRDVSISSVYLPEDPGVATMPQQQIQMHGDSCRSSRTLPYHRQQSNERLTDHGPDDAYYGSRYQGYHHQELIRDSRRVASQPGGEPSTGPYLEELHDPGVATIPQPHMLMYGMQQDSCRSSRTPPYHTQQSNERLPDRGPDDAYYDSRYQGYPHQESIRDFRRVASQPRGERPVVPYREEMHDPRVATMPQPQMQTYGMQQDSYRSSRTLPHHSQQFNERLTNRGPDGASYDSRYQGYPSYPHKESIRDIRRVASQPRGEHSNGPYPEKLQENPELMLSAAQHRSTNRGKTASLETDVGRPSTNGFHPPSLQRGTTSLMERPGISLIARFDIGDSVKLPDVAMLNRRVPTHTSG